MSSRPYQVNSSGTHLFFNNEAGSLGGCGVGVDAIEGKKESLVTLGLALNHTTVTITMVGPSSVWHGVGFNTQYMARARTLCARHIVLTSIG